MTINEPICFSCKHYNIDRGSCPSFPKGIPDDIYIGSDNHDKVHPDQVGKLVFEETETSKQSIHKRIPNR